MIHVNDMKNLRMYKSANKLFLPLSPDDNKHGSLIYLLTTDIDSSIRMINNPMVMNRNTFRSYFIDKSINAIIKKDTGEIKEFVQYEDDSVVKFINEDKLIAKERNKLDDSSFGIPDTRSYPLNDKSHVKAAIRMFNHCPKDKEKTLAKNIIRKMKQFGINDIQVSEKNRFSKYYKSIKEVTVNTSGGIPISLMTDYRFEYYTGKDVKTHIPECRKIVKDIRDYKLIDEMLQAGTFLVMCYDVNDNLAGFGIAYKHSVYGREFGVYLRDDYFDDEEDKEEISKFIIYTYRDYMLNRELLKQYKVKVVPVYSLNRDKILMKKLKTSILQDDNFLGRVSALKLLGKSNDTKPFPVIYMKMDNTTTDNNNKKPIVTESFTAEGYRFDDRAFFFGSDIFTEDAIDNKLKSYMYDERIRTQKELLDTYKYVKSQCPKIKYTKMDITMYKKLNLFFDISYYNKLFMENNTKMGEQGLKLYKETLKRFLNNKHIDKEYSLKSIFIPVSDYFHINNEIFDYSKFMNPISFIIRTIKKNDFNSLKEIFGNNNVFFFGNNSYFKINFNEFSKSDLTRFISNLNNMVNNIVPSSSDEDMTKDSPDAIISDIVDKIETSQNIELYSALGKTGIFSKTKKEDVTTTKPTKPPVTKAVDKNGKIKSEKEVSKELSDSDKEKLVKQIQKAAESSTSTDEAIDKLDKDDYVAQLIQDISEEESNDIKVSATRKARIDTLNSDLRNKSVKGRSVREMIESSNDNKDEPLPVTVAPINSINSDQWENLQFINFNEEYNVDEDIMSILEFFGTRTVPVGIRDVQVEDTTTSEDLKETWTVACEDIHGTRFTLKFDIPLLKNNRFMHIKGNDKTINGQLMNLPIIKTEYDTAQITTNYNKIFFYTFGSAVGKSNVISGKIIKALSKYTGKSIMVTPGNNALTALKYEVPLDYVDLGKVYSTIKYKTTTIYFNQDDIREKYGDKIDLSFGLPIGWDGKEIIYVQPGVMSATEIAFILCEDKEFNTLYKESKPSVKYTYSQASILNTKIPVVVICAYCEGLVKTLNKANVRYKITDKRPSGKDMNEYDDIIKFKDGFITYTVNYNSSMLMNGLKECNTEDYSIKDINNKSMWTEQLDHFGGRIKADGLDNFYDLMFDPITSRICKMYNLPDTFCDGLLYSSSLLTDTKYNKHTDISGNRFRTNEIIAGYTYKVLSKAYADYRTKLKKTGKASMSIKQSAIIDAIMSDNTASDTSTINDLWYAEANNTVSFKGLSGLNSERSYSLEKRTYDDSMVNVIGMSTGFASTVGITRVMTANSNVNSKRGYISDNGNVESKMNDINTMTVAENLTPMCTTHDDPFRLAMSYVQRTKHDMRVVAGDPLLITNGMDDALTMFTPDVFSFNAKQDGKIIERDDSHIVIQYVDGTFDYIDLENKVYKNSDGGFYTSVKLQEAKGLGSRVKKGQLIAYDPLSYTVNCGYDDNATYNNGTLAKIAIITSDMGFEDSCVVTSYLSDALSTNVIICVPVTLNKNTNVFNMVKPGDTVQEGDPLLIIQNTFEDNDVNVLLKNLVDDEDEITSLGRIPIKSHNTGYIEDISITRTCDIDDMSPSLKKIVTEYERKKNAKAKQMSKYDENLSKQNMVQKLEAEGKLKNVDDGVLIEIYVTYKDDFSVGDKLIFLGAQKGVTKEVIQEGMEPTSSYRPEEPIDAIASQLSFDKRMITAPTQYTLAGKALVELDRQVKDIMGIKHDNTVRHKI